MALDPETRRLFVAEFIANGGRAPDAAVAAGYARSGAHKQGKALLARADVQKDIERALRQRVQELTPRALMVLEQLILDETLKPETRLAAVNSLLDRSPVQRGQTVDATVTVVDPAALIREIWERKKARLNPQPVEIIDVQPDVSLLEHVATAPEPSRQNAKDE